MLGSYKHVQLDPDLLAQKTLISSSWKQSKKQLTTWYSRPDDVLPIFTLSNFQFYLFSVTAGVAVGCSILNVDGSSCSKYIGIWNSSKNVSEILQSHSSICCAKSICGSLAQGEWLIWMCTFSRPIGFFLSWSLRSEMHMAYVYIEKDKYNTCAYYIN